MLRADEGQYKRANLLRIAEGVRGFSGSGVSEPARATAISHGRKGVAIGKRPYGTKKGWRHACRPRKHVGGGSSVEVRATRRNASVTGDIDQLGFAATKPKRSRRVPARRERAGTLHRLSRFAASRQTGERLGSGLPFGVRRRVPMKSGRPRRFRLHVYRSGCTGTSQSGEGVPAPLGPAGLVAALHRLSRFAASRQTGERLGSGLPFGVSRRAGSAPGARQDRFGLHRPVNSPPQRVREVSPPVTEALPPVQSFSFNPSAAVLSFLAWGWNYRIANAAGVGIALGTCFLRRQARRRERWGLGNMPPGGGHRFCKPCLHSR